jgi:tRNA(Ile)-lysidine synthase
MEQPLPTMRIPETGLYGYSNGKIRVSIKETVDSPQPSKERSVATLDAESLAFPMTLRPIKEGDRFAPFGMKGSKLVSDYLKDKKVEPLERHQQLVVTDASGMIIWLVERTIDEKAKVTERTKKVIRIEMVKTVP